MKKSQLLRVDFENGEGSFVTRRVKDSQLVFCNNHRLEERVLGALGRYVTKYDVLVYAFTLFGSHDHGLFGFKNGTKSKFFRDFGARTAEAIKENVPSFGGGSVFERRTSELAVPRDAEGYLDALMYTILQPIAAGLCKNLSDYDSFNSFHHMVTGKPLEVSFVNNGDYNKARKRKRNVDRNKYVDHYTIKFARLPGYEHLAQKEYGDLLRREYERRRKEIIDEFERRGYKWPSKSILSQTRSTHFAKNPKKRRPGESSPICKSKCPEAAKIFAKWLYGKWECYSIASKKYLSGQENVEFPHGTNKPPGPFVFGPKKA